MSAVVIEPEATGSPDSSRDSDVLSAFLTGFVDVSAVATFSAEPTFTTEAASVLAVETDQGVVEEDGRNDGFEAVAQTPDEIVVSDSGAVCVDAEYLSDTPPSRLVHTSPILADVLCPSSSTLPCATDSHGVFINSRLISYATLCKRPGVHCTRSRMLVNSVLLNEWIPETHDLNITQVRLSMYDVRHPVGMQHLLHSIISMRRRLQDVFCIDTIGNRVLGSLPSFKVQ